MKIMKIDYFDNNIRKSSIFIILNRYWYPDKDTFLYCIEWNENLKISDYNKIIEYENKLLEQSAGINIELGNISYLNLKKIEIRNILTTNLRPLLKNG